MIQVATTIEERAVLASGTVRNRIRMCGRPAVPSTRAMFREITSRLSHSPSIPGVGAGGARPALRAEHGGDVQGDHVEAQPQPFDPRGGSRRDEGLASDVVLDRREE